MTDNAFSIAQRKARYGHRDWLVWRTRRGELVAAPSNAANIKAAMLATGTQGCFTRVCANNANGMRVRWWLAVNMLANAKRGY